MRKNRWMLGAAALVAAIALVGCGANPPAEPDSTPNEPTAQTTPAAQEPEATAEPAPQRAEKTNLTVLVEGDSEAMPATLFTGNGYSIYIPDEGWQLESEPEDGIPCDKWEPVVNDDVELKVLRMEGRTLEEAKSWVILQEDDFTFTEDKDSDLIGEKKNGDEQLIVEFFAADNVVYVVQQECPLEAVEGFGARMRAMAESFQFAA